MTEQDEKFLKECEARANLATPPPWPEGPATEEWIRNREANANFARRARQDIPHLIGLLRIADSEIKSLERYYTEMADQRDSSEKTIQKLLLENKVPQFVTTYRTIISQLKAFWVQLRTRKPVLLLEGQTYASPILCRVLGHKRHYTGVPIPRCSRCGYFNP